MSYDPRLWDGSDPSYAPGLVPGRTYLYWRPTKKYLAAGWSIKSVQLPGLPGDGRDLERAEICRERTREMLAWFENSEPKIAAGTWQELIARYRTDDVSPFRDVKANTKETYRFCLERWNVAIGHLIVADTTYADMKRWQIAMQENGRSVSYQHRMFGMIRMVASYGVALDPKRVRPIRDMLAEVKVKSPKHRTASPTRAQVLAIAEKADEAGSTAFATGILMQFWLTLRARDVRGDFMRMEPGEKPSGITRGGFRWCDGLTWDMIDRDVTMIEKVASKTEDDLPETMIFDLTALPDIRARLMAITNRVGPVIVDKRGMPYDRFMWSKMWRRFRKAADVPDHIWMMDTRAGAINDAKLAGASQEDRQRQANHASPQTTERYTRGHDVVRNNVIRLRAEK